MFYLRYSSIDMMDQSVGSMLKALKKSGEADNTIVFYVSDHGGTMIRSKRYLYDSGTRVPCIAYFPEKWKHLAPQEYQAGKISTRLIDFTDIIKTLVSLCGVTPPESYAGTAFAGKQAEPNKQYALLFSGRFDESHDLSRGLTDGRYKYIRNYEPDRRANQLLSYPRGQAAQLEHFRAYQKEETNAAQSAVFNHHQPEEFYDTQSDPHEVNNLIKSKDQQDLITTFRQALDEQLLATHDLGFIPEPLMESIDKTNTTIYEWARIEGNYPLKELIQIANTVSTKDPANLPLFQKHLSDPNPIIRYWGALGIRILASKGNEATQAAQIVTDLQKASTDTEPSVRITAHTALGKINQPAKHAVALLKEASTAKHDMHACWALGGAKFLEFKSIKDHYPPGKLKRGSYSAITENDLHAGKTYTQIPE